MPRYDDDDRPRRSWRDIDRKKDGSVHIDRSDPYRKSKKGARTDGRSKSYRSALDKFFEGGDLPDRYQKLSNVKDNLKQSGGSPRQKAIRKLREAVGRFEVKDALTAYLEIDPELPQDVDALLAVLQHPDEGQVQRALALLDEMSRTRDLPRKELLRQRLRQVEDLSEERETIEMAAELRRKL